MATADELADLVREALFEVAPDLEGEEIVENETFQDQFGIDSMDSLNLMIALHERTGLDIPEADYPALATLASAIAYLEEKLN